MAEPDQMVSTPEDRVPVRWGLGDAAVGWLVGLVGGGLAFSLALVLSGTDPDDADGLPLGWVAVAQTGLWLGLLGAPWLAARLKGNGLRRDFGLYVRWRDLPVGGIAGLVGQIAILWVVYLPLQFFTDISSEDISEPSQQMADKATGPFGVVLLVLIVGIGAPIVEEIFYRGLVQRSLLRRFSPVVAVGAASLLFGAAHMQPLQFPALALAGALFGYLAHRYRRLGPAIAAHVVFNMTAVIVLVAG